MQNTKMDTIMKGIRVLVGLAVIVGVAYWGYTSTRSESYTGSELSFKLGGGDTVIKNTADDPVMVGLTTTGSRGSFTIASDSLDTTIASTREGSGTSTVHSVELELPPGSTDLRVTRGSDVTFTIEGQTPIEAQVAPMSTNGARTVWIVVAVVVLGALYFISRTFEHGWVSRMRRLPGWDGSPEQAST